jgi:FRG domain
MEERKVNTWEDFERQVQDLRKERESSSDSPNSSLLFRGQEDSSWLLKTTLDRKRERMLFIDYYHVICRIQPQIETLTEREWPIPDYPEVEKSTKEYDAFSLQLWSGRCPGYAYMAYLRHHGFPSPLLDWTRSPHVAGYFAFSKASMNSTNRVSIYVFSEIQNKLSGNKMPVLYRYGPYVRTHRRHVLQQSEYTLCLGFDSEWRFEQYDTVFDRGLHQQATCVKYTIPAAERPKVLRLLDAYNLNAFSLFGSEESMMETLAIREFHWDEDIQKKTPAK